ncbi:hypothetical protein N9263_00800 [Candidatus Marinimicrobia bacterium]|nr:hypothetical protein [Candidatus Neomarinimicrobiota bacterium]
MKLIYPLIFLLLSCSRESNYLPNTFIDFPDITSMTFTDENGNSFGICGDNLSGYCSGVNFLFNDSFLANNDSSISIYLDTLIFGGNDGYIVIDTIIAGPNGVDIDYGVDDIIDGSSYEAPIDELSPTINYDFLRNPYPNPSNGNLFFDLLVATPQNVQIYIVNENNLKIEDIFIGFLDSNIYNYSFSANELLSDSLAYYRLVVKFENDYCFHNFLVTNNQINDNICE